MGGLTSSPNPERELGTRAHRLFRSALRLPSRLLHAGRVALDVAYWTSTFQLRAGLRRRSDARLIRRSGLFDADHYLAQCGGDRRAAKDPVLHYLERGAAAGLDPSPLFSTRAHAPVEGSSGNALAEFIRAGGAGRPEDRPAPHLAAAGPSPGEELLARHAFRAASRETATRALVVVDRVLAPDQDSRSARTFVVLELLREMGHPVTFVSEDAEAQPDEDALREMGAGIHRGFPAALAHLVAEGHRYRFVMLSGARQAFRYLPSVRAYAPQAVVVYDSAGAEADAPPEDAGAMRARSADHARRVERANVASADVVLVVDPEEREAISRDFPGARVEVVPNVRTLTSRRVHEHLSAEVVKTRLASVLAAAGPLAAPREGAGGEGSAA